MHTLVLGVTLMYSFSKWGKSFTVSITASKERRTSDKARTFTLGTTFIMLIAVDS